MVETIIAGRLTADPTLRTVLVDGVETPVCNFTVAAKYGQKNDKVAFIDCAAWRARAAGCAKYLKKGRIVTIKGIPSAKATQRESDKKIFAHLLLSTDDIEFMDGQGETQKVPNIEATEEVVEA